MPSLHTEIGIMVAILVGAWASKVVAVALYMYCHRRRLERLGLRSDDDAPRFCTCHKPTPAHVIKAFPIMPYTRALQELHGMHDSQHFKAAATAVPAEPLAVQQQQPQQDTDTSPAVDQQARQQQLQQQIDLAAPSDLQKTSTPSMLGAVACSSQQLHSSTYCTGSTGGSDTDCCPVCFTEYEPTTEVRQLPCKHFYHTECIDAWLNRDNTCPLCKSMVWMPAAAAAEGSNFSTAAASAVRLASVGNQQQQQQQQEGQGPTVTVTPRLLQIIVIGGRGQQ